jgi:hypothetical protein
MFVVGRGGTLPVAVRLRKAVSLRGRLQAATFLLFTSTPAWSDVVPSPQLSRTTVRKEFLPETREMRTPRIAHCSVSLPPPARHGPRAWRRTPHPRQRSTSVSESSHTFPQERQLRSFHRCMNQRLNGSLTMTRAGRDDHHTRRTRRSGPRTWWGSRLGVAGVLRGGRRPRRSPTRRQRIAQR